MGGGLHQIQGVCKSEEVEEEDLGGSRLWDKSIVQCSIKRLPLPYELMTCKF